MLFPSRQKGKGVPGNVALGVGGEQGAWVDPHHSQG